MIAGKQIRLNVSDMIKHFLSVTLYHIGHFISVVFLRYDFTARFTAWAMYPIYNWCMITSCKLDTEGQIWCGLLEADGFYKRIKKEVIGMGDFFKHTKDMKFDLGDRRFYESPENWTYWKFFGGW